MAIILIALAMISGYCFSMWLFWAYRAYVNRATWNEIVMDRIATFTFRLGITGTIALGFLGLILKG